MLESICYGTIGYIFADISARLEDLKYLLEIIICNCLFIIGSVTIFLGGK